METVKDILVKQGGLYAKYAQARLLSLRYQTRLGLIAACDQGAPKGRWRCAQLPEQGFLYVHPDRAWALLRRATRGRRKGAGGAQSPQKNGNKSGE